MKFGFIMMIMNDDVDLVAYKAANVRVYAGGSGTLFWEDAH